jgi:SH3-like domain-containing protein
MKNNIDVKYNAKYASKHIEEIARLVNINWHFPYGKRPILPLKIVIFMQIVDMRAFFRLFTLYITLLLWANTGQAANMPYYASIKSKEANIRTGPSPRYPIQWVYERKSWPVKVTASFETWRKITDIYGEIGWIHQNLLSKKRHVLINSTKDETIKAHRLPMDNAGVVQLLESGVIAELIACENDWCQIRVKRDKSWVKASSLWGIDENDMIHKEE